MNHEKRREIVELVGLAAVVVSLFVLTLEVRQNTNALYAQSRQAILEGSLQELLLQFENPDLALSIVKDEPLTPEEQIRLDAFLSATFRAREFAWLQFRDGVIDRAQFDTELTVIGVILDSSRIRKWWDALGRQYFSPEFVEFIDRQLGARPSTNTLWQGVSRWDVD